MNVTSLSCKLIKEKVCRKERLTSKNSKTYSKILEKEKLIYTKKKK